MPWSLIIATALITRFTAIPGAFSHACTSKLIRRAGQSGPGACPPPCPIMRPDEGMAVLMGESPYELSILPGGWQAYQIGPSANEWGYLVDVNPRGPAPEGAYVESKILPEYFAGQWVDVLWLRAPGILDFTAGECGSDPHPGLGGDLREPYEADARRMDRLGDVRQR